MQCHVYIKFNLGLFVQLYNLMTFFATNLEVGVVYNSKKLRKTCVLDYKCSKRSYVLARISTSTPKQNLLRKLKSLGYSHPLITTPKWESL